MKKIALILIGLMIAAAAMAQDKLVVWSFTDELQKMMAYYQKDHPDANIQFVLVPNDVYQSKLKPVLQSGEGAPDVFTLEAAFVKGYVETGWMADLSSLKSAAANTLQYTKDVTTDSKGVLRALSWQATPGAFFYRRSMAKQYLGTDDPVKVQAMVSDLNKFAAVGEKIKAASGGSAYLISSTGDIFNVFKAGRKTPWVKDGKFYLDPVMDKLFDVAKAFKDKGLEADQSQWTEGWFAGMKGALADANGKPEQIFGYLLPTWGLHYVLKPNAKSQDGKLDTSGDWAMCQGPIPYFWGGTWVTAYSKTKQMTQALALIKYLTTDEKFLTAWAKDTGDLVSNTKVVDAIKGSYKEDFLGGQNHYAAFAAMAKNVNGKILTGYDQDIEKIYQEQLAAYVNGEKDKKAAIQAVKDGVASQFPDLKVN
jgi:hypothetical protein